ncbi:MAG: LptF/LptG family permease [Bacteriovoracaceae bacterium]|nr:LptF/LptG family permease [Bacteriovoracaceae bacterium]
MYLLKKLIVNTWFRFFIGASLLLFLLLSTGNLISGLLRSNVTPIEVLFNHIIEIPLSLSKIFPVACLMATLFGINKLKSRNELTAIFASGYSRRNFIINIIQASGFVAIILFLILAFLDPFAKKNKDYLIEDGDKKFKNLTGQGLSSSTFRNTGKIWYKSEDYYVSYINFSLQNNTLYDISFYAFDSNYHIKQKVHAKRAIYLPPNWEFQDGVSYTLLHEQQFSKVLKFKKLNVPLKEFPTDFSQIDADINGLSILDLAIYIMNLKKSGINTNIYEVHFWNKFSLPFLCIIFALIASSSIFNPSRRTSSFGKNIFSIFVFTILYWLINSYLIELGKNSKINPVFACFAIPLVFSLYLAYMFYKNRKLR